MAHDDARRRTALTGAAWAALFVFATTSTLLSVSLKQIGAEFQVGFAQRGALATVRAAVLALSALAAGWAADRRGKTGLLVGAMLVIGAGLIWIGSSGAYGTLVAALAVIAVGLGCVEALVSPLVAELHPDDVPTQMNVLHAFYPAGIVVPSLLVGWLLSRGLDWRVPFRVCALPAVLVGLAFLLGRGRQSPDLGSGRRLAPMSVRRILAAPAFPLLAVAMLLAAGCEGGLFYWIPNYMQEVHGAGPTAGGVALTAFSVAMMVGRFGAGAATRVVPQRRLLVWLAVGGLGASVGLVLAGGVVLSVALCAVAGLCAAAFWPGILSLAAARISVGSATLYAMLSVCGIAGFGAMPFAVGAVGQWLGLRAGMAAVPVGFAATAAVLALALRPVQGRPAGAPPR